MISSGQDFLQRLHQAFIACGMADSAKRQWGEKELQNLGSNNIYPLQLLFYLMSDDPNFQKEKLRAAIAFKNWAKEDWV